MRRHPFSVEKTRFGQRECTDASRCHPAGHLGSLAQERQQPLGRLERWLVAAPDDKRIKEGFVERLGLDHQSERRPYGPALLREKMHVVAALAERRVRGLEDGHRREAHHVKTWKRHHSYTLQGNLPPSVINVALFDARAISAPRKSDRGSGRLDLPNHRF
jgi:hypothetical protein